MYPNIIINNKCVRFIEVLQKYLDVKNERVIAKKNGEQIKDKLYKLILNSFSGLLDNKHSPLYYAEGALRMRIMGQLTMLLATDRCLEKGYQVIALNTDSIDVIIDESQYDECVKTVMCVGDELGLIFEEEKIQKTVYANINNYIQIGDSGKVKRKGFFKYGSDIPLGDSINEQIIPIALTKYFVDGIAPVDVIRKPWEHGIHIYDYCVSKKVDRSFSVIHNGKEQQRLNRYYFSKHGAFLYKVKNGNVQHMHKDSGVRIFNTFEEKTWEAYDINYNYYLHKVNTIIAELEKDVRQASLFD